jgi:hypothetical protein
VARTGEAVAAADVVVVVPDRGQLE